MPPTVGIGSGCQAPTAPGSPAIKEAPLIRTTLPAFLALTLALPSAVMASTEGPQVRVALSARPSGAGIELAAVLINVSQQPIDGTAELRLPAGLSLADGPTKAPIALAGGATVTRSFRLTGNVGERVAAQLVFSPTNNPEGFSRGRVFLSRAGDTVVGMTTAQAIDADAKSTSGPRVFSAARLPRLLDAPAPNPAGDTAIRGRLAWYDYSGNLAPGAFADVELVPVGGGETAAVGRTDREGNFQLTLAGAQAAAGKSFKPRFTMGNDRWLVKGSDKAYAWEAPAVTVVEASTVDAGDLVLPKGLPSSEAAWIHGTLVKALEAFASRNIDVSWWKQIGINWPADGDYYSWGDVNLTEPYQWDVIGHEFGHAVFFTGTSSAGGGGQHKIDQCYSAALAWSEGWATFFCAVCNLDRAAPDAKFQFLVPRRAPIRIENVPADVCQGETNEWRVSAALWDLYDSHDDGTDAASIDFDRQWGWMRAGNHLGSLSAYWALLKKDLSAAEAAVAKKALEQAGVSLH